MQGFRARYLDVAGRKTHILRGGRSDALNTIFVHGGIPGVTPYCSGSFMWGRTPSLFADQRDVICIDLPGCSGTEFGSEALTLPDLRQHVLDVMDALDIHKADYVGHDLGGLVGIEMALSAPSRMRSLSIVASAMSAPTADGLDNLLLVSPPQPLWGAGSQVWALDRLSYAHQHIDRALVDACVAAAEQAPHQDAVKSMRQTYASAFAPSVASTKYRLWEACRNDGVIVPVQIVWGSHDPTTTRENGVVLFNAIAKKQSATQFHLVNRSGHFPFREQPEAFHHIVAAFQEGLSSAL
jgi:pimeloyl-ACP methyl ester carboxylesterase